MVRKSQQLRGISDFTEHEDGEGSSHARIISQIICTIHVLQT